MKVNAFYFQQNDKFKLDKVFHYYLTYYYNYRNLVDPTMIRRLYRSYNTKYQINTILSLEVLEHPDFHDFCNLSQEVLPKLKKLYYQFPSFNQNLIFSIFILSKDYEKATYFKDHLEAFKKFTIEEVSRTPHLNPRFQIACEYLIKTELINLFSQEELLKMYKKNTSYYLFLPEVFQETIKQFKNKSPMIYLDSTKKEKFHIRYFSHQLIKGVPFDYHLKYNIKRDKRLNFPNLFLYNNEAIAQLYLIYYKNYQKQLGEEGNLFDFIGFLFNTKTITSIYQNPNISVATIQDLEQFLPFYDKKIQQKVSLVKEELRKRNLTFYKALVDVQEDKEALRQTLLRFGLHEENVFPFLFQNKFLDNKRKESLLNIVGRYFGNHLRVIDILLMIEESQNRNIPFDKILEEKEISKALFQKIYKQAEERNPILYQCIDEQVEREKKKNIIKTVQFGYRVLDSDITSIEDYNEKFPNGPSYNDLINKLQKTELASSLVEKASSFGDFDSSSVHKSLRKKL